MKLNDGYFPLETDIIHFSDEPFGEINFKGHLNGVIIYFEVI